MLMPTFSDVFKSFYYSCTYVPPVDLSDQALSKHLLKTEDGKTAAATAQKLISNPDVQSILSKPVSHDNIENKNDELKKHGFKILGSKQVPKKDSSFKLRVIPFYGVIEHEKLPGWVIKTEAARSPKESLIMAPMNDKREKSFFVEEENILRIKMAERIAEVAQKANIEVVVPEKKLVAYSNSDGVKQVKDKYCVICKKINVLSAKKTVKKIKGMSAKKQKELARKISTIVRKVGMADASFDNIRLTPEGKIAFINTEPAGLMVAKKPGHRKSASVEKCGRIGLFTLMHQTSKGFRFTAQVKSYALDVEPGLEAFREQVKNDYEKNATPKLSKWKITLSVLSLGTIPMVNVIVAFVKTCLIKRTLKKLQSITQAIKKQDENLASKSPQDRKKVEKYLQEVISREQIPLWEKFISSIEGVPFSATVTPKLIRISKPDPDNA